MSSRRTDMNRNDKLEQIGKPAVVIRITAVIVLLVMINNLAGFYFAFYSQQNIIKKEVKGLLKSSLNESELVKLQFDINSDEYLKLQWLDEHEFRYHGRMFDIIRVEMGDKNHLTFYCINDIKEEQLFADLKEHVSNHIEQNPEKQNISKILLKVLSLEFYQIIDHTDVIPFQVCLEFYSYGEQLAMAETDIPSPPPRFS
jgi:hypothetical protein